MADAWPMIEKCMLLQVQWSVIERTAYLDAHGVWNRYDGEPPSGQRLPLDPDWAPPREAYRVLGDTRTHVEIPE